MDQMGLNGKYEVRHDSELEFFSSLMLWEDVICFRCSFSVLSCRRWFVSTSRRFSTWSHQGVPPNAYEDSTISWKSSVCTALLDLCTRWGWNHSFHYILVSKQNSSSIGPTQVCGESSQLVRSGLSVVRSLLESQPTNSACHSHVPVLLPGPAF